MESSIIPFGSCKASSFCSYGNLCQHHPAQCNLCLLHGTHPPSSSHTSQLPTYFTIPKERAATAALSSAAATAASSWSSSWSSNIIYYISTYFILLFLTKLLQFLNHLFPSLMGFKGRSGDGVFTLAFVLPPMAWGRILCCERFCLKIHNSQLVPFCFLGFVPNTTECVITKKHFIIHKYSFVDIANTSQKCRRRS